MSNLTKLITKNAKAILQAVDLRALSGKTVLLTGASGLIGIHMLACIKEAGADMEPPKVAAVVNREPLPFVKEILEEQEAQLFRGDLTDIDFCRSLPAADFIIHTAGYGQPVRILENPLGTLKLNTLCMYLLFEKLLPGGSFLFVSTSEVYTGLDKPPFSETQIGTTNPGHPRSCYIEAKRCGEAIVNAYRQKGVNAKSARLALAYGPGTRTDDKRAVNSLIQKGMDGAVTLLDAGAARRAYCYVTDAVELLWKILLDGTEAVYNVGGVEVMSIADMAGKIGSLMHVPVIFPEHPNEVAGGSAAAWLDMTKANTELNKTKYVSLDEGLRHTIEWYLLQRQNDLNGRERMRLWAILKQRIWQRNKTKELILKKQKATAERSLPEKPNISAGTPRLLGKRPEN